MLLPDGVTVFFVTSLAPLDGVVTRLDADPRTFAPLAAAARFPSGEETTVEDFFVYTFTGGNRPGPTRSLPCSRHRGPSPMARWMPGTCSGSRSNRSPSAREAAAWSWGAARSTHTSVEFPLYVSARVLCAKIPIIQAIHPPSEPNNAVIELLENCCLLVRWYKAVAVVTDIQQLELAERFLASSITSWAVPRQCDRHGMPCSENACRCRLFSGRPAASVSRRRLHRSSTSVSCGNAKSPIPPMRAPGGIISPSFASRRVRGHQRQTIRWPSNSGYSARELPMPRRKPSCWNMPMHAFARIRLNSRPSRSCVG